MKKQKGMVELHEELVIEIMTRLPPKSLIRFRCLCKSWKAIFSTSVFIRMHLNRVKENQYNDMQHLILTSAYRLQSIKHQVCGGTTASDLDFPLKYPLLKRFPNHRIKVLGSCNGLLCVSVPRKTLILWNPSIKEFKKLPLSYPLHSDMQLQDSFGFGYDPSTNDYKVVRFANRYKRVNFPRPPAEIYSLKSNTWKSIQSFSVSTVFEDSLPGTLVGGVLYWNALCFGKPRQGLLPLVTGRWILGFDLALDKFETLFPPKKGYACTLGTIGGCLSVAQKLEGGSIGMWKLDPQQGWIKVMTIMGANPLPYLVPICVMKKGQLLITYTENWLYKVKGFKTSEFELYDPVKSTFRKLQVGGMRKCTQAIPYTQSLVSPNAIGLD
ncbi:hypothetical protein PTKIN_Ptkin17bG0051300 [Pterospermum kingtungense]